MRQKKILLGSVILFLISFASGTSPSDSSNQAAATEEAPYVQIVSTTVDPDEIHTTGEPTSAKVIVRVRSHGHLPPEANAKVEVFTASSDPVGNNVDYSSAQTQPLNDTTTQFEFKLTASDRTIAGSLVIQAAITGVTQGIRLKDPPPPCYGRARLETVAP